MDLQTDNDSECTVIGLMELTLFPRDCTNMKVSKEMINYMDEDSQYKIYCSAKVLADIQKIFME